jgi:hypothetical protein
MEQQWEELQQLAAESSEMGEVVISQHFPELYEAIQATGSINVNIPEAALQTHEQNLENLQVKLQEMDNKYEVSSNFDSFASINLEEHFPEIYEIENYQCSIDTGLFEQFDGEFNRFFTVFSQLMKEIISESDLPVFQFTRSESDQLKGLLEKPPCFEELAGANELILKDLNEFHSFATSINDNLGQWEAKWFARGNESVYEESQRLAQSSARLIQLIVRQRQLEHETTQAKTEMDESYEQLQFGYGRTDDVLSPFTMTEHVIDVVMNPRDSEKIQQDLDNHQAAVERYESALNARERGWGNLQRAAVDWTNDIGSLASSVSRLRLNFRLITDFQGLTKNPVTLNFPENSLRLAKSCITSTVNNIATTARIFREAFKRYYSDLGDMMRIMVPETLYLALELKYDVIIEMRNNIKTPIYIVASASKLGMGYGAITSSYTDLGLSLAQNPMDPDYLKTVESKVETLSENAEDLSEKHRDFRQAWADAKPEFDTLLNAVAELRASLESNRSDLPASAARLLDISISLESMLNGMEDLGQSAGNCVTGKLDLVKKATSTFPQRSQVFMNMIAEKSLDTVPDEVKQSISNLLQLTNEQISNYADLRSWEVIEEEITNEQTIIMATAFAPLDFVQYHNEFLLAMLPVPQPDAIPKLEILTQSFDDMVIETQELRSVIEEIIETDQQALQELQSIATWARGQESEIVNDFADLQWIAFDGSPILSEIDKLQDVGTLWSVALIETPGRIQDLTVGELAQRLEQLRPQVEQGLQNLMSQTTAGISCANDAIQSRAAIANRSISTAASQAIATISSDAPVLLNALQNILNPASILFGTNGLAVMLNIPIPDDISSDLNLILAPETVLIEQILNATQNLQQEVQQSDYAGQTAFENLVSGSFQQMQDAISCVNSRSQTIQQIAGELSNYYSEIEGTQQFQQMQFIQGTTFNPNN